MMMSPGSATENFLKRWIAFSIGGVVALVVEVVVLPVKARVRLVECLAATLRQISKMESFVACGIENQHDVDIFSPVVAQAFERASGKAKAALGAAETFFPFCSNEPRLKGSFEGAALVYGEIVFVLHQVIDRMDNMLQLRTSYGSGPLEEYNSQIFPYRRNLAASITITLFAVHEALITKLPLPQFLPSARLAQLRMINRVREVVREEIGTRPPTPARSASPEKPAAEKADDIRPSAEGAEISPQIRKRVVRRKFMAWNAASAAQVEIIEYLEELIDLTKLLVGANEFRTGLLTRGTWSDYAEGQASRFTRTASSSSKSQQSRDNEGEKSEEGDNVGIPGLGCATTRSERAAEKAADQMTGLRKKRSPTLTDEGDELPVPLKRIATRRMDEKKIVRRKARSGTAEK